MKKILINATYPDEIRVALTDNGSLYELDVELTGYTKRNANIYSGVVTRVEPSLEAAFIDYGGDKQGFLTFKNLSDDIVEQFKKESDAKVTIKDVLKEGQEILVQIEKEERGNKGVVLSNKISLAGNAIVLLPNSKKTRGVSKKLTGEDKQKAAEFLKSIDVPEDFGVIIRTSGGGATSIANIDWELKYLQNLWEEIKRVFETNKAPVLIHKGSSIFVRTFRDYLRPDIDEVIIDDAKFLAKTKDFVGTLMPSFLEKIKFHDPSNIPLFVSQGIENQIEGMYAREIKLPSGGVLVFDITEALTSIDINSSRATQGSDVESTALNTNLEAAKEIAKQVKLRDIGGLIVIDFIDMFAEENRRKIENTLFEAFSEDKSRIQFAEISKFGLLEMSRQRLKSPIEDITNNLCPHCKGSGFVRGNELLALSILRIIEQEISLGKGSRVIAQLPTDIATFILNEKRERIAELESLYNKHVVIIPDDDYKKPNYNLSSDTQISKARSSSNYKKKIEKEIFQGATLANIETPVISNQDKKFQTSSVKKAAKQSLLKRLIHSIFGTKNPKPTKKYTTTKHNSNNRPRKNNFNPRNNNKPNSGYGNQNKNSPNRNRNASASHRSNNPNSQSKSNSNNTHNNSNSTSSN